MPGNVDIVYAYSADANVVTPSGPTAIRDGDVGSSDGLAARVGDGDCVGGGGMVLPHAATTNAIKSAVATRTRIGAMVRPRQRGGANGSSERRCTRCGQVRHNCGVELLTSPEIWISLLTLTVLEVVLGIDNIVFISVLTSKLPREQQARARTIGLGLAMGMRILLLLTISWVIGLTAPLFTIAGVEFSGRDVILIGGGLFLLAKATTEIHEGLEGGGHRPGDPGSGISFRGALIQIVLLDAVFSLDSVITAVGMADEVLVMIAAVVIAIGVMLLAAAPLARFVEAHPTVKMLALSFLLLIGMSLVADGFDLHIPKGYIYFAMGFSIFVELINLRVRARGEPVHLRPHIEEPAEPRT